MGPEVAPDGTSTITLVASVDRIVAATLSKNITELTFAKPVP